MKLHTRIQGDGPRTALLVHGGTVDSRVWNSLAPRVAALGYTVLAPDLRGHGLSPRGSYSPEAWADDLVESLPESAGGTVDVAIGHSLGATVLSLAVKRLRPRRAVYAEPGFEHDVKPPEYFARIRSALSSIRANDLLVGHPKWTPADAEAFAAGVALCDPAVLDAVADLSRRHTNYVPERAETPSLLLLAGIGSVVRPAAAGLLADRGFEVATLPEAGHDLQLDDPDGFLSVLTGWL
ncbi:alpha/beta fold hydrolase [Streptomyces hygroscopicus]|uniref:alpha/beta fold hydrolase n=1 Tax=Streptomyces hygroscopicus TaxID=1912 RepID=UPI0036422ADA